MSRGDCKSHAAGLQHSCCTTLSLWRVCPYIASARQECFPCGWHNCPASRGDEPRRGGGGLTPTGTTPDVSTGNINESEKERKLLTCMGNPSGPSGHLPYKAEEFCLRTDKLFAAMDFKSVAAYQRGSMKPFPTIFLLLQECLPTRLQIPRGRRFLCCFLLLLLRRVCAARMLHLLSKKTECHEMLVKNRQIVPFWMIFVTRLLRNPAQIADFCAIFLHKTGLLCKVLSESFTFWSSLTRNFGAGT